MANSRILARALLAVTFLLLTGITACSSSSGTTPPPGTAVGTLSGDQEVPPVATAATGSATVVVSADQTTVNLTLELSGTFTSEITAAHFHHGAIGVNGPPFLLICGPGCPAAAPATLTLSFTAADFIPTAGLATFAEAVSAIMRGDTYINVHTVNNPNGEIRGQITASQGGGGPLAPVWYVDNSAAAGGNGSQASPFNTLAAAAAASAPGDIIFVFAGSGTDAGQNLGVTLKSGQKLIGEGAGLPQAGIPAGAAPLISNAGLLVGGNTPVVMLSAANEVKGLTINAAFNEGVLATTGGGHSVNSNTFTFGGNGREGVRLLNISGEVNVSNNTMTGSLRPGIKLANNEDLAGDPIVAPATVATLTVGSNTITGSARDGINVVLDGTGSNVTLRILGNTITNSTEDGVDIDVLGAANIAARVQGNTLSGAALRDVNAQINATSTICLELIGNGNDATSASFEVNNSTGAAAAFRFHEAGNDTLAIRSGGAAITDVALGTCGVP